MNEIEEKFNNIILIPCSGAEYHGELARKVAIQLIENSKISILASMTCSTIFLKNVLLGKDNMVELTKKHLKNSFLIVINGCNTACASQIYEHLEIKPDLVISVQDIIPKQRLNLNDLNSFKNKNKLSEIKEEDIKKVIHYIYTELQKKGLNLDELESQQISTY